MQLINVLTINLFIGGAIALIFYYLCFIFLSYVGAYNGAKRENISILLFQMICLFFSFFATIYSIYYLTKFQNQTTFVNYTFIKTFSFLFERDVSLAFDFYSLLHSVEKDFFFFTFGFDGISLVFALLTNVVVSLCLLLAIQQVRKYIKEYFLLMLSIQGLLNGFFLSQDLITFYIMFEAVLIPMYLIIGLWGTRERRIHAAYQFFLYTLLGSIFMLFAILNIHSFFGTTSIPILSLIDWSGCQTLQLFLWGCFFFGFAIKIPMIPFHLWLPEAHVEAPTGGSVILASLLLKLGGYGFIKVLMTLFAFATHYFSSFVQAFALVSIVFASITTLRQIDLKKIIAYTSVAHMNLVTLGLFSLNIYSIYGGIYLMLAHGIVSGALFICIGIIYERFHTRILYYCASISLTTMMPLFSIFFFLFSISNFGFPGSGNFVGEFLITIGLCSYNFVSACLSGIGFILSAYYSIWLHNRLCFRSFKFSSSYAFIDLRKIEVLTLGLFLVLNLYLGLFPNTFLQLLEPAVMNISQNMWL